MTHPSVTCALAGGVAVVRLDDSKANALSHDVVAALDGALDDALAADARAVALLGRPGRFSAGFDLRTMQAGPDDARDLLRVGAELALRLYRFPAPVVMGCTGHALAMGAILLLAGDLRIGARGEFKIGMNEVAIGMPVPRFAVELAEDRLSAPHRTAAVALARVTGPDEALAAGYLDEVVDPDQVEPVTLARAAELAGALHPTAFRLTRGHLRDERAKRITAGLAADIQSFTVEPG